MVDRFDRRLTSSEPRDSRLTLRWILVAIFWIALGCGVARYGSSVPMSPATVVSFLANVSLLLGFGCIGGGVGLLFGRTFLGSCVGLVVLVPAVLVAAAVMAR